MKEQIDLVVGSGSRQGGVSLAVVVSFVLHSLLIVWMATRPPALPMVEEKTPIVRYVELMRQNPQEFTEAPGPAVDEAPMNAPYSDANRRASMPEPTGATPTKRPGDGGGIYTPPSGGGGAQQPSNETQPAREPAAQEEAPAFQATQPSTAQADDSPFAYREPVKAGVVVDWRAAMKQEARKIASLGNGQEGVDLRGADVGDATGGEKGFAESGPLSFETKWYDWGPYAQSMVSRIRVNWHAQMPMALLRTGLKGVVTIRFTIHRDGRISDIALTSSSDIPPYDFAARKAIELSSPLNPLPKDFPNPTERVTCMFYYNMQVPK